MSEKRTFARSIGSLEDIFSFLSEFFQRENLGEGPVFAFNFVVEELFTNMVKYNIGSGGISIEIRRRGAQLLLDLVDEHVDPFDIANAPEKDTSLPVEEREPGGLGLQLVKSMVDKIAYEYRNRTMTISVAKYLEHENV